jgi:hypothetical protein
MEGAHVPFDSAVAGFPAALRGRKPNGAPHTAWQLLEHMRIAQEDILDFSRNPQYREKQFPDDYWPAADAPPDAAAWDRSIELFHKDLEEMKKATEKRKADGIAAPEFLTAKGRRRCARRYWWADHNSYHLGQLVFLRKMLEAK